MVYSMAKETGWPEHHILWELPAWRVNVYYLCALRAAGVWFESALESTPEVPPEELLSRLENLPAEAPFEDPYDFLNDSE
jgi:hypothetical protein